MKNKSNTSHLEVLLNKPHALYEKFHHHTKNRRLEINLPKEKWPESWQTVYYKAYSRLKEIKLPKPILAKSVSLTNTLLNRNSSRTFSKTPLSKNQISTLLYYSAGLRKPKPNQQIHRFYPSAGARYPLEVYFLSCNTQYSKGLYHYYVKNHSLEELLQKDSLNASDYIIGEKFKEAACFLIITACFKRSTIKYGDRGYRLIQIEAGHLGQNIYLLASALHLSCCAIGGFIDDKVDRLLDVDGVEESVLYVFALGNK